MTNIHEISTNVTLLKRKLWYKFRVMWAVNFVINARVFMAPYLPINGYTCIFDSFRMSSDISWHHMAVKDILAHNQYIMAKVVAVLSKSETPCIGKPHSNMPKLLQWRHNEQDDRWPVNSPRKGPVTREMFQFDDVIMLSRDLWCRVHKVSKFQSV